MMALSSSSTGSLKLDFRLDSLGDSSSSPLDSSFLLSNNSLTQQPSGPHRFVSRELQRALDMATSLRSDRAKRPAPRTFENVRSRAFSRAPPEEDVVLTNSTVEVEDRIKKAFDECLLQPGIAKTNPAKRRYFGSSINGGIDNAYESLGSDDNDDGSDDDTINDVESLDSSNSSSSSSSSPTFQSSTSHFIPSPYLHRDHPYKLVEEQYYNRLRKRNGSNTPSSLNRLPKGYREVPAPFPSSSSSSNDLCPPCPNWIVLNVHHLRPSSQRFCQLCFSSTHHTRMCPVQRCLSCGRESHSFRNCPDSSKTCTICGSSGHDHESLCPSAMMERSTFKSSPETVSDLVCCIRCGNRGHYLCDTDNEATGLTKIKGLWNYCCHCGNDRHVLRMCRRRREFRVLEGNMNRRPEYVPPIHTFAGDAVSTTPIESTTSRKQHHHDDKKQTKDSRYCVLSSGSDSSSASEVEETKYEKLSKKQKKELKKQEFKRLKEKARRKKKQNRSKSSDPNEGHQRCVDESSDDTPAPSKSKRQTNTSPKKEESHSSRKRHHSSPHHSEDKKKKKKKRKKEQTAVKF